MRRGLVSVAFITLFTGSLFAQTDKYGTVTGNFQLDGQVYQKDKTIGADAPLEKYLMNSYGNVNYNWGKFSAGLRIEGYLNTKLGFNNPGRKNDGIDMKYRFIRYNSGLIDVTAGSFYEQFGSGLILRSYEEKTLGLDNALDGFRVVLKPAKGIVFKGLTGYQRKYFENGKGIVRGFDGEISVADALELDMPVQITLGGSFVSKYEDNEHEKYNLPANVGSYAGRININTGKFNLYGEYAEKINDPSSDNNWIYKKGNAYNVNLTYSTKGFGALFGVQRVDNMSTRSERTASLNEVMVNFIPAMSRTHTYSLAAMYPYSSQPNGEFAFKGELSYRLPKKSFLGGKYGTMLSLYYSRIHNIDKDYVVAPNKVSDLSTWAGTDGYSSGLLSVGDQLFYQEFNLQIERKVSRKFKLQLQYLNQSFNYALIRKGVLDGEVDAAFDAENHTKDGMVHTNIFVADLTYKWSRKFITRFEIQELLTDQDKKDWVMGLLEMNINRKLFVTIQDLYNYGSTKNHYPFVSMAYVKGANRIQLGYGRKKDGYNCANGICVYEPSSTGFVVSISTTF
ncbi:MAG: DUF6029 family protein [Bacteroidales bacterium]|jgi:hypothetical protein|nr:DUF6029 family protein [Bacteroidales bacterium]